MSEIERQIIHIILEHIAVCNIRFAPIKNAEDFISVTDGELRLDAIAMRLLAIGENVKKIYNLNPKLQLNHPNINWDDIIRFRDFISHHYEFLDYEIVYNICQVNLPVLKNAFEKELAEYK